MRPHRQFELDAEQILDNRTGRHHGEALTLRTTSNTRLKNVAPLRLRRTASTVNSPPISLFADNSRHSLSRNSPRNVPQTCTTAPQATTALPNTNDPNHSGTRVPPGALALVESIPNAQSNPGHLPIKKGPATLKDGIAYLLKFAPKEAYIDDLMNGRLYINAAGYYNGLPGEQGNPLEASMAPGLCLYSYAFLPIYCMYTVRENDIVGNAVKIPIRMIQEFGRADGWIGIVQYDSFARLADRHIAEDGSIYAHGPISYGVPGPKLIREIFEGIPHNLVIKTPKYAYQKEYRIIGSRPVECRLLPDENHPGCEIEKYEHAELDLGCSLADFSWKVSVPCLDEAQDGLMLKLLHCI